MMPEIFRYYQWRTMLRVWDKNYDPNFENLKEELFFYYLKNGWKIRGQNTLLKLLLRVLKGGEKEMIWAHAHNLDRLGYLKAKWSYEEGLVYSIQPKLVEEVALKLNYSPEEVLAKHPRSDEKPKTRL